MKGIIVFYVNFFPELQQNEVEVLEKMQKFNSNMISKIEAEGYSCMFLATTKEATRVEKIDFDSPFPRYVLPRIDIVDNDKIMNSIKDKVGTEENKVT